jgi:integrase
MTRRGHGEGSIYREPNGLWAASIELGRGSDGKRRRKKIRAKTKRDLQNRMTVALVDRAKGLPPTDKRRTVSTFVVWWEQNVLPGTVKEGTADGYRWMLSKHILPRIGSLPLVSLGPEHVIAMLREMERDGLSPRTRRQARAILRRVLRDAERLSFVHRNSAALVDAPRIERSTTHDALTAEQARALISAADSDRLVALVRLVLTYGMRKGEALALTWEAIDFKDRTITIRGTMKRHRGGGFYVETPKSAASGRTLDLTPQIALALRKHRKVQAAERLAAGSAWQSGNWVFASTIGTPLDDRNVSRWWHDLCETAGVEHHRFHSTRHTAATLMLEEGESLDVISRILGHSSVAITGDVYARPTPRALRSASMRMDRVLGES